MHPVTASKDDKGVIVSVKGDSDDVDHVITIDVVTYSSQEVALGISSAAVEMNADQNKIIKHHDLHVTAVISLGAVNVLEDEKDTYVRNTALSNLVDRKMRVEEDNEMEMLQDVYVGD